MDSDDAKWMMTCLVIGAVIIAVVIGGIYLIKSHQPAEGWDAVAEDLDANGGTVRCDGDFWHINANDDVTAEDTGLLIHKANGGYTHLDYAGITTVAIDSKG